MISVCIYGSEARRRTDILSDRDLLIIGDSQEAAVDECQRWKADGWNVSFFTQQHFTRLIDFQSLFVQHIKLEGIIIRDDNAHLKSQLEQFCPAKSYVADLKDALLPVDWIDRYEERYWARLCIGDILFVAARNVGILYAATNGIHVYDYPTVIEYLSASFSLDASQRTALFSLRHLKAAYRARSTEIDATGALLKSVLVMKDIRDAISPLEDSPTRDFLPNNYHALRRAELELVRNYDPRDLDRKTPSHEFFELWQLVCNPADYPKLRAMSDRSATLNLRLPSEIRQRAGLIERQPNNFAPASPSRAPVRLRAGDRCT
ncbi:hypothetical protein [Mesorhizobium caraganae]|uniref:hypothetical protein n=1 Tax=Mesorhizobium caraganae TaxID=483206 RepID=UPI003ED05C3C